ncbi:MAG: hypothetical protein ACI8TX_002057 [Hyphomicrobiaceae bacterium]
MAATGTWIFVASSGDSLGSTIGTEADDDPRISTDGAGNWIAVWTHDLGPTSETFAARSTDDGVTWAAAYSLSAAAGVAESRDASIDNDRNGLWAVAFLDDRLLEADEDVVVSVSGNLGDTWSSAVSASNHRGLAGDGTDPLPELRYGDDGRWLVAWVKASTPLFKKTIRNGENDLFLSRSKDPSTSWSDPQLVNNHGRRDDGDASDFGNIALGFSPAGDWVVAWSSEDDLDGTIGIDNDIMIASAHDDCPVEPALTCLSPSSRKAKIKLVNKDSDSDKLVINMKKIAGVNIADFGDPTAFASDSAYTLCLYDDDGGGGLVELEKDMLGQDTCKGKACWRAAGTSGFRYRDGIREHGAIKSMSIKVNGKGEANIRISADSSSLGPPIMPLLGLPSVTLQLINQETGDCWESVFSAPDANTASLYKASSD